MSPGYTVSEYFRRATANRCDKDAIERGADGLPKAGVLEYIPLAISEYSVRSGGQHGKWHVEMLSYTLRPMRPDTTMPRETVVDPQTLSAHPEWLVFDCRFDLTNTAAGRAAYDQGHVPGAMYAHLDDDLSGSIGTLTGRHPLPDPARFAERLSSWGVATGRQVVVYDDVSGAYAVRLWWMLRWLGHREVAMLDGGWARWCREGFPVSRQLPELRSVFFHPQPRDDWVVDSAELQSALAGSRLRLVDLRASERYRGEKEPIDPVAGHIPGAFNLPHSELLDSEGNLRPAHALEGKLRNVLGATPIRDSVFMCGSGVTACLGILAARAVGLGEPRLYAGSWSEWIRDPQRPVAGADRV